MALITIYAKNGSFVKFRIMSKKKQLAIKKELRELFEKEVNKK